MGEANYTIDVQGGGHRIVLDEPPAREGQDRGMTPKQLISASLAGCICITLRMYADRKGWPLDAVDVDVEYGDLYDREAPKLNVFVDVSGALNDEMIGRLKVIAEKCPIHKILHHGVDVQTQLRLAEPL